MDVCWENSGIARVSDGVAYLWTFHRRLARRDRGLLFALAAISTLSLHLPADLSCATGIALDGRILVFTATISLVTGFLFGLGPMFGIRHVNAGESLKRGDRVATGTQSHLRSCLAVAQIAIAIILLIGAGLMAKSFWTLVHVAPGFRTESILT